MEQERRWPWEDVTFTGVYWNDPDRVYELLKYVRPWFKNIVVGVQTNSPDTDQTYDRARRWADQTLTDHVQGHCEPTIGKVLGLVKTPWVFLVSADEWPSKELLESFQDMLDDAAVHNYDGFWIRMLSAIEGTSFPSEQDNHLRVFKRSLGWPKTLHSRPAARKASFWKPEAILHHDRSLDEMMQDYLRYYQIGRGNPGWDTHNAQMMLDACSAIAHIHGWPYVTKYEWWPQVKAIAFKDSKEDFDGDQKEGSPRPKGGKAKARKG